MNVAEELPAATFTEAGTLNAVLLEDTATVTPAVGAVCDIVTVQVKLAPEPMLPGLQLNPEGTGSVLPEPRGVFMSA